MKKFIMMLMFMVSNTNANARFFIAPPPSVGNQILYSNICKYAFIQDKLYNINIGVNINPMCAIKDIMELKTDKGCYYVYVKGKLIYNKDSSANNCN